jgi:hypothetical protein
MRDDREMGELCCVTPNEAREQSTEHCRNGKKNKTELAYYEYMIWHGKQKVIFHKLACLMPAFPTNISFKNEEDDCISEWRKNHFVV